MPAAPGWEDCLLRTRNAVLNVLVVVALAIAASGWLLRRRAEAGVVGPSRRLHDVLLMALLVVGVASYLMRRTWARRASGLPAARRMARFYVSHVGAAAIAGLGVPLGLAYGWWVDPRLEAVAPFWVLPLALGFLSIPRRAELDDLDPDPPNPEAPST